MKKVLLCVLLMLLSTAVTYAEIIRKKVVSADGTTELIFYSGTQEVARQRIGDNGRVIKTTGKVPDGVVRAYHSNGVLVGEMSYEHGKLEGIERTYYKNGNLRSETTYKNGKREGVIKKFYGGGTVSAESHYKNDTLEGITTHYYRTGVVSDIYTYKNGQLVNRKTYDEKGILRLERDFPKEK